MSDTADGVSALALVAYICRHYGCSDAIMVAVSLLYHALFYHEPRISTF